MSNPVEFDSQAGIGEGLHVSLLGAPQLTWKGRAFPLARRESRALLYRLATHPVSVPREELAFLFWPESPEKAARRSLTFLLGNLRRTLPSRQFVLSTDDGVGLDWSTTSSDTVTFQQLLTTPPMAGKRAAREQAVQIVRGQFLAGFSLPGHPEFEAWAAAERSTFERLYLESLFALVDERIIQGEYPAALGYARRYLATDELAESIYRRLMALYVLTGDRRAALQEFEHCVVVLERELHLDPSPQTRRLYQAVLDAHPAAELIALLGINAASASLAIGTRPSHNLPASLTSFVGRQAELVYLRQFLSPATAQTRLLTLTGAGGSGKTRLALEAARSLIDQYPDGVWWIDLAPLTDPGLVPQAIASVLGIKEERDTPILDTLPQWLDSRRLLLLLDNCEHLLDACGNLAEHLLTACPHLVVLATSREAPLGVPGETTYLVAGLSLPSATVPPLPARIEAAEAVQLLVARAISVRRDFALTEENAEAVSRLCIGLDGLPLALELAAAQLNALTVGDLVNNLDTRFRILAGATRRGVRRHQTLQAAIDWSYQLLSEAERHMLQRLSIFAGGFSREAAEQVCAGEGIEKIETFSLLTRLLAKSLLVMQSEGKESRYRLLETIRQFALERLHESGMAEAVRERHARYFSEWSGGTDLLSEAKYRQLGIESANVRAALNWLEAAAQRDDRAFEYGQVLLRLAAAFAAYCSHYGWILEGRDWMARVLKIPTTARRVPARAWLLYQAGTLFYGVDFERARSCLNESISISRELNDRRALAIALSMLSLVVRYQEGAAAASPISEEALGVARAVGDKQALLAVLKHIGLSMHTSADDLRSRAIREEQMAIARELKDEASIAFALFWAGGGDDYVEGNYQLARAELEEALTILDRLQGREWVIATRFHLAFVLFQQGELHDARRVATQAVQLAREMGERRFLAMALMSQALVEHTQGQVQAAIASAEEAVMLGREVAARGDKLALAWALMAQGRAHSPFDPIRARTSLTESVALNRALNIAPEAAWALFYLAWQALSEQDSNALAYAQEALALAEERKMPQPLGWAHLVQGEWARQCGEHEQAAKHFDQAERVFRAVGANGDLGILLQKRGLVAEAEEDPASAASFWVQSLWLARQGDSWAVVSANLRSLARVALALGRAEWAAELIGAAEALNVELVWSLPSESERYRQDRTAVSDRLGAKLFAAHVVQGQSLPSEQVDALAQRVARLAARVASSTVGPAIPALHLPAISPREVQVLGLVAERLSDAEIAARLVISPRTVTTHLTSIYRKLGVGSRNEAVQAAAELGFIEPGANT